MSESRAITAEEGRDLFVNHITALVRYWKREAAAGKTDDPVEGVAHSILCLIDGISGSMPAFRVLAAPHPDDEAWRKSHGENWWPDGLDITEEVHLHHMLHDG